jgi:hypothetical protein
MFAGVVGLFATPLFAASPAVNDARDGAPTVAVQRVNVPTAGLRDEAAMVLVGTALIGLAAAVRRAA